MKNRRRPIKQSLIPLLRSIPPVVGSKKGFRNDHEILAAGWTEQDIQYLIEHHCVNVLHHYKPCTWEVESRHIYLANKGRILAGQYAVGKHSPTANPHGGEHPREVE